MEIQVGPRKRKLFVVREKDALEPWMKKFFVELGDELQVKYVKA
ncbi:unnamed protein product [Strongylus vulgaris]|uniref:Uncharacterized protein n=1 Tax=Strongylus vulgaris TaxID=40348 RepID=A0A3P7J1Q9_STRVU|nr:unnamed protein product [Strongylus vulgaris]